MPMRYRLPAALLVVAAIAAGAPRPAAQTPPSFNLDTGIAPIEIIAPMVVQALLQTTTPNDAPIILRHTTIAAHSWYDAIAPYHPTAIGVSSNLPRRPASERTQRNKNIAMVYSSYRVMNSLLPQYAGLWRSMVLAAGLNPDDTSEDLTTAVGIGNVAGRRVAADREHDGMNQLGDEGGQRYNRHPYEDYTGYAPVNTPQFLFNPSRWQPLIGDNGLGKFQSQIFVTPQWGRTRPYSYASPARMRVPRPAASDVRNFGAYKAQADEVIAAQANLTDAQKAMAEFFDHKLNSLGLASFFMIQTRNLSLDDLVIYDFLTNMAAFDAGIATWKEKYRFDTVRPTTAIHYLYGNRSITGWAGPGKGIVTDLPAREWRSYLNTGNHPEYPSGSACFCAAHAQASRRYFKSDAFGLAVPVAAGSSLIEPGITPASTVVLGPWDTFTAFETDCAEARVLGGVHFRAAVEEGANLCRPVGDTAFEFLDKRVRGVTTP
ncbi:MAG: vanadium-dependent haloperoxidase [Vicinamibacterales bacterium]